jgi:hypothetical protein
MKKIYSSSQIVGGFTVGKKEFEACATGDAQFDEENSRLVMNLDSFIRPVDLVSKEEHLQAGWLPQTENVREGVSSEEAPDLAREIFHRWVHKVQQAMPSTVYS